MLGVLGTAAVFLWPKKHVAEVEVDLSTPPGIRLQPLGISQGYRRDKETAAFLPREEIVYADENGMTLYTYDRDSAGTSSCIDECAALWPPAIAPADAAASGGWTVIQRADGSKQWALNGKPLYRFSKDIDIGSVGGNSPARFGRGPNVGNRGRIIGPIPQDAPLPEGWRPAHFIPRSDVVLPPGFGLRDVEDAAGLVFIYQGDYVVYWFDGHPDEDACGLGCPWEVIEASALAETLGDFSAVTRADGVKQWTYKSRPLYTFLGDRGVAAVNGAGIDPRWRVAHIARHYMPATVRVGESDRLGKILVTVPGGKTLYRRDAYIFQSGGGHTLRHGNPVRPAVGRDIGTNALCANACEQWQPFIAPADAKPQAYWSVAKREDGRRQWVYKGFALWMYAGDAKPGDTTGNDSYDIFVSDDSTHIIDIGTPYDGLPALYWAAAIP